MYGEVGVGVADEVEPVGAGVVGARLVEETRRKTEGPVIFIAWPVVVVVEVFIVLSDR